MGSRHTIDVIKPPHTVIHARLSRVVANNGLFRPLARRGAVFVIGHWCSLTWKELNGLVADAAMSFTARHNDVSTCLVNIHIATHSVIGGWGVGVGGDDQAIEQSLNSLISHSKRAFSEGFSERFSKRISKQAIEQEI